MAVVGPAQMKLTKALKYLGTIVSYVIQSISVYDYDFDNRYRQSLMC